MITRAVRAWNTFWFAPSLPDGLGLARMVFFSLVFLYYVRVDFSEWGDLSDVFWMPINTFKVLRLTSFSVATLALVQVVWKAALLLAALGLFTRLSTLAACVGGFYLLGLPNNFGKTHHYETVLVIAFGLLCVSRCGDAWSLDAVVRAARGRPRRAASGEYTWPIRAIWTTCALIFFAAGIAKLRHGGLAWMFSDNLGIILVKHAYHISNADPVGALGLYVAQSALLVRALAVGSVLLEAAYPLALFSVRARWVIVPGVAAMQLGIRVLMGPSFEQYLMAYIFWIPWYLVPDLLVRRAWTHAMLFDGDCGLCQRTVRVVERLDVRHVVLFRDVRNDWRRTAMDFPDLRQDACLEEMHVVTRGRVYTGFYAYRALAWSLPAVWPLVPMLYLPGVPFIGRHVYRWVAERRLAGTCPVPPAKLPSSPIPVVAQRSTGWDGSIAHDEATPAAPPSPPAR